MKSGAVFHISCNSTKIGSKCKQEEVIAEVFQYEEGPDIYIEYMFIMSEFNCFNISNNLYCLFCTMTTVERRSNIYVARLTPDEGEDVCMCLCVVT